MLFRSLDGNDLAADAPRLSDEANTIGLFGGQRVIRVSNTGKSLISAVEPLLKTPPIDARVIVEGGDLGKSHALRIAFERSPSALAVPCFGDQGRALDSLVDEVMSASGLTLTREAKVALLARLGADRRLSRQELDKLVLYVRGTTVITIKDVEATIGDVSVREVDDIIDAAFAGGMADIDLAYRRLVSAGEDPTVLLGFVLRHAQGLLVARAGMDGTGRSAEEALMRMRPMSPMRRANTGAALMRWPVASLRQVIHTLHTAATEARLHPRLGPSIALRAVWTVARRSAAAQQRRS